MKAQEIKDEWLHLEENDPPPDLSREDAAFERERAACSANTRARSS